jgi:hypothetical protein
MRTAHELVARSRCSASDSCSRSTGVPCTGWRMLESRASSAQGTVDLTRPLPFDPGLIVGGVGLVGAATLFLTAPQDTKRPVSVELRPQLGLGSWAMTLRGTW